MKNKLVAVLALCILLSGCGSTTEPSQTVQSTPEVTPTPVASQSPETTPSNEATPELTATPMWTYSPVTTFDPNATPSFIPITPNPEETPTLTPLPTEAPTPVPQPTEAPTPAPQPTPNEDLDKLTVEYGVKPIKDGVTFTGRTPLPVETFTVYDPENKRGNNTAGAGFSFGAAKDGKPHNITVNNQKRFDDWGYNALAWDNKTTDEKVLYLTFDCGYKYKDLTLQILDTLKEKQVSAAFFCTTQYLNDAPEEIARMINDGHIVGNHTVTHPEDCTSISREKLAKEILGVHNNLRVNFGYDSKYFRFPTGKNSQDSVELVDSVGYRSVFWSVAHSDWNPSNQPGVDKSFATVTGRLHAGAVILLHSTSPDNAAILADVIDYARENGYTFKTLDEYPGWN